MITLEKVFQQGLVPLQSAGGDEELVSDLIRFYNHDDWQLNSSGLYLRLYDADKNISVYHQGPGFEAEPTLVLRGTADEVLKLNDVTPDGQRLLMIRVIAPSQDIMAASDW